MSISDLLDTPPTGTPIPRLTPRAPLSLKELTVIFAFIAAGWALYDRLNKYAEKTTVEKVVEMQQQLRLDMNHGFDVLGPKVDTIIKAQEKADAEKATARKGPR